MFANFLSKRFVFTKNNKSETLARNHCPAAPNRVNFLSSRPQARHTASLARFMWKLEPAGIRQGSQTLSRFQRPNAVAASEATEGAAAEAAAAASAAAAAPAAAAAAAETTIPASRCHQLRQHGVRQLQSFRQQK